MIKELFFINVLLLRLSNQFLSFYPWSEECQVSNKRITSLIFVIRQISKVERGPDYVNWSTIACRYFVVRFDYTRVMRMLFSHYSKLRASNSGSFLRDRSRIFCNSYKASPFSIKTDPHHRKLYFQCNGVLAEWVSHSTHDQMVRLRACRRTCLPTL